MNIYISITHVTLEYNNIDSNEWHKIACSEVDKNFTLPTKISRELTEQKLYNDPTRCGSILNIFIEDLIIEIKDIPAAMKAPFLTSLARILSDIDDSNPKKYLTKDLFEVHPLAYPSDFPARIMAIKELADKLRQAFLLQVSLAYKKGAFVGFFAKLEFSHDLRKEAALIAAPCIDRKEAANLAMSNSSSAKLANEYQETEIRKFSLKFK